MSCFLQYSNSVVATNIVTSIFNAGGSFPANTSDKAICMYAEDVALISLQAIQLSSAGGVLLLLGVLQVKKDPGRCHTMGPG